MPYACIEPRTPDKTSTPGVLRRITRRFALTTPLVVLLASFALPVATLAQTQEESLISRTPEEISKMSLRLQVKFMSPYCPGANLRDCTSGQAQVLRDEIRDWVVAGHSEDWITARMVDRFGEEILSAPPFRGFGMLAWIMPVVALLVGLFFVMAFLKRQNRMTLVAPDSAGVVPRDYVPSHDAERQLEEELNARIS